MVRHESRDAPPMTGEPGKRSLFRKLDNFLLHVSDLDAAKSFYRDRLGHILVWRDEEAPACATRPMRNRLSICGLVRRPTFYSIT